MQKDFIQLPKQENVFGGIIYAKLKTKTSRHVAFVYVMGQ